MSHPEDELLFDYAHGEPSEAIESHLEGCSICGRQVSRYREFAAIARSSDTWRLVDEQIKQDKDDAAGTFDDETTAHTMLRVAQLRDREDRHAEALLRHMLTSAYNFAAAKVLLHRRYYTPGVARLLCTTAFDELDRNAQFAKMLAETAAVIAEAVPDDHYPCRAIEDLRGTAWLYFASACGSLAQFDEGHPALDRAARAFSRLRVSDHQLARVDMHRAVLLSQQRRNGDALNHARAAVARLRVDEDPHLYFEAVEIEAGILLRLGDAAAARTKFEAAYAFVSSAEGDVEATARVTLNLAVSCREGSQYDDASRYFHEVIQICEATGNASMMVHAKWSLARLSLQTGNAAEAALRLPKIISEFESAGKTLDSAFARLDLVSALIALGDLQLVRGECERLAALFTRANILNGALTAIAYMKDATDKRTLTTAKVRAVREYVAALAHAPNLQFTPPES